MNSANAGQGQGRKETPQSDLECVWVKAGLIASKLCDLDFDCENCPLDVALRQGFHAPREEAGVLNSADSDDASRRALNVAEVGERILNVFFQQLEQFSLRDDRYYFRAHTWVQNGHGLTAAVGVDDLAARLLPHANSVVFPAVRSYVNQGDYCTWLVGPEAMVALVSPVTGTIVAVNDELYAMPDLVKSSPYEKGWLVKIELEKFHLDMRKLLPRISAHARSRKDIERLRRQFYVHSRMDVEPTGVTLFDGGRYVENVQALLGMKKYVELISGLFKP